MHFFTTFIISIEYTIVNSGILQSPNKKDIPLRMPYISFDFLITTYFSDPYPSWRKRLRLTKHFLPFQSCL